MVYSLPLPPLFPLPTEATGLVSKMTGPVTHEVALAVNDDFSCNVDFLTPHILWIHCTRTNFRLREQPLDLAERQPKKARMSIIKLYRYGV